MLKECDNSVGMKLNAPLAEVEILEPAEKTLRILNLETNMNYNSPFQLLSSSVNGVGLDQSVF